jgi:hypothetical protein
VFELCSGPLFECRGFVLWQLCLRHLLCRGGFGLLLLCHWQVPPHDGRLELRQLSRQQVLRVHLPWPRVWHLQCRPLLGCWCERVLELCCG